MNIRKAIITVKCIKVFRILGRNIDKSANINIGKPLIAGIHEVQESVWLIIETLVPQIIRNIPYLRLSFSMVLPKKVYSLWFICVEVFSMRLAFFLVVANW